MPIDRRDFVKSLAASFTAPAISSALPALGSEPNTPAPQAGRQRHPNVVLMICDDLGYGDLGCYGSSLRTPNLDGMAARGLRFTRLNAGHPICSASRAALLTGRYGLRSGTSGAFNPLSTTGTSRDETLLSDLFRAAGYSTKAIGKWHLGHQPEYLPTSRGFDSYYGVPYSVDMKPLPLLRDTATLEEDTDRDLLTPRYTGEAVRFIEESGGKPFFLYMAFSYPHDPARASERFRGKTRFGDSGDAIAEIDWSVGEVLSALDRKGLTSDTVVLFTSDHGPWYQGSPGLLRGRKASTFEGGFRVPFLAQWPGTIPAGQVRDAWCSNLDVLPTLANFCALKLPARLLDGVDISPVFHGTQSAPERRPVLYFAAMGNNGIDLHCTRREQWKLRVAQGVQGEIYLNDRSTAARASAWLQHPELYDLSIDPAESYDVARLHPEIVHDLLLDLEAQMQSFPPDVTEAYAKLKQNKGGISTPAGASPRSLNAPVPATSWEPPDRRDP